MEISSVAGYEIVVEGYLGSTLSLAFEPLKAHHACVEGGTACTVISGDIPDQAALFGILFRLRDLGLTLVAVRRIEGHIK